MVSASNMSTLRFLLAVNSPAITMSTYPALLSVLLTWDIELRKVFPQLFIRFLEVTKAYLEANSPKRRIINRPQPEMFNIFAQIMHNLWQAI